MGKREMRSSVASLVLVAGAVLLVAPSFAAKLDDVAMLVAVDSPASTAAKGGGGIGKEEQARIDEAKKDGRSMESSQPKGMKDPLAVSPAEEKRKKGEAKEYAEKNTAKQEQWGKVELKARAENTKKYWANEKAAKTKAYAKQKADFEAVKERTVKLPTNQDPTVMNPWAPPEERPAGRVQDANLSPSSLTSDNSKVESKPAARL